jgi:hypothetical protein
MKTMIVSYGRRVALVCLAGAVLNLQTAMLGKPVHASGLTAGELTVAGNVKVDGAPGVSGQTFFPGSTFVVAAGSHSTLTLRHLGRIELSSEATLKLSFAGDYVTGALEAGRVRVFAPAGVNARFTTGDATVWADSGQASVFSIQAGRGGGTYVSVEMGRAGMSAGEQTQWLSAGQSFVTPGGSPVLPGQPPRPAGGKKRVGAVFGFAGVIALLTVILLWGGDEKERELSFGGCVIGLSPTNEPPAPCE